MEPPVRAKRILVVDDHPGTADALAKLISVASPFPVELSVAYDAAGGWARVQSEPPDVAIVDVHMPVLSGTSLALRIRSDLGAKAPMLIALTGDRGERHGPGVDEAFDHFVVKPADVDLLVELISLAALD